MWRSFFLAIGVYVCLLGVQALAVERAVLKPEVASDSGSATGDRAAGLGPLEPDRGWGRRRALFVHDPATGGGVVAQSVEGGSDPDFAPTTGAESPIFTRFGAQSASETPRTLEPPAAPKCLSFAAEPPTIDRFTVGRRANRAPARVSLSHRTDQAILSASNPTETCRGHSDQAQDQTRTSLAGPTSWSKRW